VPIAGLGPPNGVGDGRDGEDAADRTTNGDEEPGSGTAITVSTLRTATRLFYQVGRLVALVVHLVALAHQAESVAR
jgi:hypothetical protein